MRMAGFWARAVAHLLDSIVLNFAAWLIECILLGAFYLAFKASLPEASPGIFGYVDSFNALYVQYFNVGIYLLIAFPYFVWGHFQYGTTLGKLPLRIRVVQEDGTRITLKQSVLRFFGYFVSYIPLGAGYLMAAFHPQKRALHELISGTRSIYVREAS